MMNIEEFLAERFLHMYSHIITHFHDYIDVFHSTITTDANKIEHIKKKIHRKYQKKLTIDMLREAKAIYDDCALTINIYLQKPVCKRFLLILKTAGFERIKFGKKIYLPNDDGQFKQKQDRIRQVLKIVRTGLDQFQEAGLKISDYKISGHRYQKKLTGLT